MSARGTRLLYLLEREDGAFKIGSAAFPAGRMRQLEKAQGHRFAMLGEWRHPNAFRAEMLVHQALRDLDFDLAENGGNETYWAPLDVVRSTIRDALTAAAKELGYSKVTVMRRLDAIARAAKEKK